MLKINSEIKNSLKLRRVRSLPILKFIKNRFLSNISMIKTNFFFFEINYDFNTLNKYEV